MSVSNSGAVLFPALNDKAKVWIYIADRNLNQEEVTAINRSGADFASQWLSHGREVKGEIAIIFDRVLIVAASEEAFQVSGCSIDKTVGWVRELGSKYQINFFDRFFTCVLKGNAVEGFNKEAFRAAVQKGYLNKDTLVFHSLAANLGELRRQPFLPLADSWHARVFQI